MGSTYGTGHHGMGSTYGTGHHEMGSTYGTGHHGMGSTYGTSHGGMGSTHGTGHHGMGSTSTPGYSTTGYGGEIPIELPEGSGSGEIPIELPPTESPVELSTESPVELPSTESPVELIEEEYEQPLELEEEEEGEFPVEIPDDECCSEKTVGGIHYYLVGTGETEVYNCLDNCIYHSANPRDVWQYCFRPGRQPVQCNDATVTPAAGHHHPTSDHWGHWGTSMGHPMMDHGGHGMGNHGMGPH